MSKFIKIMIILLAVVCLAGVALWLAVGRGPGENAGGQDTPYPYSYAVLEDGSIRFTIAENPTTGYRWVEKNVDEGILSVSFEDYNENAEGEKLSGAGGTVSCIIKGIASGLTQFTLVYERNTTIPDQAYAIDIRAAVDENLALAIEVQPGRELPGVQSGGEESDIRYSWSTDQAGVLTVALSSQSETQYHWTAAELDSTLIQVFGPALQENESVFKVSALAAMPAESAPAAEPVESAPALEPAETALVLLGEPQQESGLPDVKITLALALGESGVLVGSQLCEELKEEMAISAEEKENKAAAEEYLGQPVELPREAIRQTYDIVNWEDTEDSPQQARAKFVWDKETWRYNQSRELSRAEVAAVYEGFGAEETTLDVGSINVTVYSFKDGTAAVWRNADNVTCSLDGPPDAAEAAGELVKALIEEKM